MSHQDDANLKVIISRIQQRRGLKQDLPQPLRPGEIGFATDSRQIYIGADTDDPTSKTYNKTVVFETTQNAQDTTIALANSQIIKFEVPHIRFPKGSSTFDGTSKSVSWKANTSSNYTLSDGTTGTREVFGTNITNNTNVIINQNITNKAFKANEITVIIDGVTQDGDVDGTGATVNTSFDYNFITANSLTSDHTLYFRSAPSNSQDVSVTYYSNTHVNHLFTASGIVTNGSSVTGFYSNQGIEDWQQLNADLVLVNKETGTGWIGLESKHIDVIAGLGSTGVSNVASVSVGSVVAAKNPRDPALLNGSTFNASTYSGTVATATSTASNITIDTGTTTLGLTAYANATSGDSAFVWLEGTNSNANANIGWLNQKLLPVGSASGNTIVVDMPANSFVTAQSVNNVTISGANLVVDITGLEGDVSPTTPDVVSFIGNATLNSTYNVLAANATTFTIADPGLGANITSGVTFINTRSGNVQLYSSSHGFEDGDSVTVSGSSNTSQIANSAFTVSDKATNTFFITPTATVTEAITGNVSPEVPASVVLNDMIISPGIYIDLSGETTLNGCITKVNQDGNWLKMSLIPDSTDKTYLRSSDQTEYLIFDNPEDGSSGTWANIGISTSVTNRFTKQNHTVKSKFESWLNALNQDASDRTNILSNVFINDPYNSITTFGTYDLDVNSTTGEIDFDGYEEAGNFAEIVNKLYFETASPNIKGLTTIKTNIELLTTEAQEARSSTVEYSEPNELNIPTGVNTISSLGTDSSVIDTLFIDYVLDGRTSLGDFYSKVGTLSYVANPLADGGNGTVVIQDVGTEYADSNITINDGVVFTANIANGTVTVTANNTISPATSNVTMKYITRRWKSF